MREFVLNLPATFIPLFVAIDVFWVLPVFLGMTEGAGREGRRALIRQSIITAFAVSLIFTAVGHAAFTVLGITVNDFKIAGGLLLLAIAVMDLVRTSNGQRFMELTETSGVVPIGVPLIVGPAVLTTIIVLVDHYGMAVTVTGLVLNLLIVWACMRMAVRIVDFLGLAGIVAISKIMSILLASIAVMMIRLGMEGMLAR
jgi:multiple antibiotic resistance protein